MNTYGFITTESEENSRPANAEIASWQREHGVAARASVSAIMKNDKHTRKFLQKVNLAGMIAYSYRFHEPSTHVPHVGIPRTYMDTYINAALPTSLPSNLLTDHVSNEAIERILLDECVAVEIMDPTFEVHAEERLFPIILKYLRRMRRKGDDQLQMMSRYIRRLM
jgi:hypothetical protein